LSKFGPSRGEIRFRLLFSLAGLAMLGAIIAYRGMPTGPAFFEVVGLGLAFFGGTAVWAIVKLSRPPEE
jgi:hypothetical protein